MNSIFAKLTADELSALAVPVNNVLGNVATGDGSTTSVIGQAEIFKGMMIALSPQIQKIGVNDLAASLQAWFNSEIAKAQTALTTSASSINPATIGTTATASA